MIQKQASSQPQPQQKEVVQKAVVTHTEEEPQTQTYTPLNNTTSPTYQGGGYSSGYSNTNAWITFFVIGGIVALLAMVIPYIASHGLSWTVWQWIIGIGGGAALFGLVAWLIYWLDDEVVADYYVTGVISIGIVVLLNFILLVAFGGAYKIIFYCFSVLALTGGAIMTFACFDECEEEWGRRTNCRTVRCGAIDDNRDIYIIFCDL